MSVLFQAMTSNDDDEIQICLDLVLKASQLGLVHESVSVNNRSSYTRSWFACKYCRSHRSETELMTY